MSPPPSIPDHELLRLIGRGAYGEVWLARNVMGIMRAVKIVRRSAFETQRPFDREFAAVKRYEPVSRVAAGLVNVLHAGRDAEHGIFFYVMELADSAVAGINPAEDPDKYVPCTLRTQLGRLGRMPQAECQEIAVSLTGGIAALHRLGLVHRDIKPSNIIFVNGAAKLADIGLVGDISESRSYVGTEGYVPPEGPGRPGADLYSLGRVFYEMATGYEAQRFPSLPPDWAQAAEPTAFEFYEIVLRCCEPDERRRYTNAEELLADLALLQSGQSVRQVRQMKGRIALLKRLFMAAAGISLIAGTVAWWQGREAKIHRQLLSRAETAEAEARQNLQDGLLQQAQNARRNGDPNARFAALALLEKASSLRPGDPALRDTYISTLTMPGLEHRRTVEFPYITWGVDESCSQLLTVDLQGTVQFRNAVDGQVHGEWKIPNAEQLAVAGVSGKNGFVTDSVGRLWILSSQEPPKHVDGPGIGYKIWQITPDGKTGVVWAADGQLTKINLEAPTEQVSWKLPYAADLAQSTAKLAPSGQFIVLMPPGMKKFVFISLTDAAILRELECPEAMRGVVALCEDKKLLAGSLENGKVGIWRWGGRGVCELLETGFSPVDGMAISPDGRFLATSCWASMGYVWDLAEGRKLFRTPLPAGIPTFSKDGTQFLLAGYGRFDFHTFEPGAALMPLVLPRQSMHSAAGELNRFRLHPDFPYLVIPGPREIMVVDACRGEIVQKWPLPAQDAAFSQDGKSLLLVGRTCTKIPLSLLPNGKLKLGTPQVLRLNPAGTAYFQVRASHDASVVACWRNDLRCDVLRADRNHFSFPLANQSSEFVDLSHDGKLYLVGNAWRSLTAYNTETGAVAKEFSTEGSWSSGIISPDGTKVLGSDARGAHCYATRDWSLLWENAFGGTGNIGRHLNFDPTGRWVLSSARPGTITLQDANTGSVVVHLQRDADAGADYFPMLSKDGSQLWEIRLATQTLHRWDIHWLRRYLRERHLDWTEAPLPPPIPATAPAIEG